MKQEIKKTADGSHTIYLEELNEQYHSLNGAIQESEIVYINSGLKACLKPTVNIFEVGFGTGLNALLTLIYSNNQKKNICYHSIENNPINETIYSKLNYAEILKINNKSFLDLHKLSWNKPHQLSKIFSFQKFNNNLINFKFDHLYDVIFFDAFGPDVQPEIWSKDIFDKLYSSLHNNGILTTYSAKGIIKRRLKETGFKVEKLPGPPGKREIIRAIK